MAVSSTQGTRFRTMAWCGHCRRTSNAEWDGLCISCLVCGKVLGDFSVWQIPSFMARGGLTKKIRKRTRRRVSTVASDQASSMNELPQMSSCETKVIHKGSTDVSAETSTNGIS